MFHNIDPLYLNVFRSVSDFNLSISTFSPLHVLHLMVYIPSFHPVGQETIVGDIDATLTGKDLTPLQDLNQDLDLDPGQSLVLTRLHTLVPVHDQCRMTDQVPHHRKVTRRMEMRIIKNKMPYKQTNEQTSKHVDRSTFRRLEHGYSPILVHLHRNDILVRY